MNPPTKILLTLTLLLAVLTISNANAEITCLDYPNKDLIILLDESVNTVNYSSYMQNSDLMDGWHLAYSEPLTEEEIIDYVGTESYDEYYTPENFLGMYTQKVQAGNETAYVIIESFKNDVVAGTIYDNYKSSYMAAAGQSTDPRQAGVNYYGTMPELRPKAFNARILRGEYRIYLVDDRHRFIHISSINQTIADYIAKKYASLKDSIITTQTNHWMAKVCKPQTDACTQKYYFSSEYDDYKLLNCSTLHGSKNLTCPDNRIEKYLGSMQVPFPSCEKDDVLDITYQKTTEFPIQNKFWSPQDVYFQDVFPIEKKVLKLDLPEEIAVKQFSTQSLSPSIRTQGKRTTYTWEKESIEPYESEGLMPPFREVIPRADYTSLQSWDDAGNWFEKLFSGAVDKEAVKSKVKELIANKTTDEEKTKVIYDWVRDQIRYDDSGMGFLAGYKPHSAGEVLDYKFGDCKDHSILLVSMLEAAGIKSYPVLVSNDKINVDTPTPYEFYHSIVAVPNGSDYIWLDPTCKYCPYGFISDGEQGSDVLMLSNPSTTFTKTPVNDKDMNYQSVVNYTISLKTSGNAEIEIKLIKTGSYGLALKNEIKDADKKTVKEDLDSIVNSICSDYDIDDYAIINSREDQILLMDINVTCNNLASKSGNKTVYNIPAETLYSDVISKEQRTYPILLETNDRMIQNIELSIPEGLSVELMPEGYLNNSQFASYSFNCSDNETILTCKRELNEKAIQLPASDFDAFKKFFGKINSLKRTIILSPTPEKKAEEPVKKEEVNLSENQTVQTQAEPTKTQNTGFDPMLIVGGVIIVLLVIIVVLLATKKKK